MQLANLLITSAARPALVLLVVHMQTMFPVMDDLANAPYCLIALFMVLYPFGLVYLTSTIHFLPSRRVTVRPSPRSRIMEPERGQFLDTRLSVSGDLMLSPLI